MSQYLRTSEAATRSPSPVAVRIVRTVVIIAVSGRLNCDGEVIFNALYVEADTPEWSHGNNAIAGSKWHVELPATDETHDDA